MPRRPPPANPNSRLCGVDEAGRGPLAGAVFAAAVILDPARPVQGLADSKLLDPARRGRLAEAIRRDALAWAVASATVAEIDELNILRASLAAMARAVECLGVDPGEVVVDGLHVPGTRWPERAVVKGDRLVPAISAASILAKTARDAEMAELDLRFPGYGFARHKGYPTPEHLAALRSLGPCEIHRRTFGPVREAIRQRLLAF
ncbi:MAG TPA: ribonuclease HII [Usitatibacteraceae bacterium]|nr:ribonuclease HII [Usitatibacteraceae bacterium]